MLKVGLIGAGYMGRTHIEVYKLISLMYDVKVCGVCDIREDKAEKAAKIHGARVYSTFEEMLNDGDIDVIDICLPTYLHFEYAKKSIEKGKAVFIEKPVVIDLEEGYKLIELQKKYATPVMVGQCVRLWPSYAYLKKVYDEGVYGRLKRISLRRNSSEPSWGWENWYKDPKKSGNAIFDLHIHDIDYLRYLMGEPEKIRAFGDSKYIKSIMQYPDGTIAEMENGWDFPSSFPFSAGFRADFENATLTLKGREIDIYEASGRLLQVVPDEDYEDDRLGEKISSLGGYFYELKYFYECLLNSEEIKISSLTEAVKSVELIYREIERMNS